MHARVAFALAVCLSVCAATAGTGERAGVLCEGPQAGHYLCWQGRPILPIGDSLTQGWMECGENFDQRAYLDALASRGINAVLIWSYIGTSADVQKKDARLGYDAPECWPWLGSPQRGTFDLHAPNPVYYRRLGEFVGHAQRRGLLVVLTIQDGWTKTRFAAHPFNAKLGNGPLALRSQLVELADDGSEIASTPFDPTWDYRRKNQFFQERFAARLIDELSPFSNVIFELFNEGEWYDRAARRRHEEHFLRFFKRRTDAPVATNTDAIAGDKPREGPADILSFHPMGWTGRFAEYEREFHRTPARPILQSEPVPEFDGANLSLDTIRASLWERILSGAGWLAQNDTSFGFDPKSRMAARASIRDRLYDQIGHAARYMHRGTVAFWRMQPQSRLASTGICLAEPGADYLVYAPRGGELTLDLSAAAGAAMAAEWFDPRSGASRPGQRVPARGKTAFRCPDARDWVLRVAPPARLAPQAKSTDSP